MISRFAFLALSCLLLNACQGPSQHPDASGDAKRQAKKAAAQEAIASTERALATLPADAAPKEIADACRPALQAKALERGSELGRTCADAFLTLGMVATERRDTTQAKHYLNSALSSGIPWREGSKLDFAIKRIEGAAASSEQIERELDGLRKFDASNYLDSRTSIVIGAALFSAWAQIIKEAQQQSLTEAQRERVQLFKSRVIAAQRAAFPRLRDAYGPAIRQPLWENDIGVKTFGSGYRTIEFTGGIFAANRNIKQFQDGLGELLHQLRFRRAQYRWYQGADRYTYYDLSGPSDSELVIWQDGGGYITVE